MNKTKKLNRQNNQLDTQIWPENQEIYGDMICYIRSANISEYEIEMVRQDLIEMILSAQGRGEGISSLFSGNYQSFCDEVIAAIPPRTPKQRLLSFFDSGFWYLSILIGLNILLSKDFPKIIQAAFAKAPIRWSLSVSLGSLVSMLVILFAAILLVQWICKTSFEKKQNPLLMVAAALGFGMVYAASLLLKNHILFTVNFFAACAAALFCFALHKLLEAVDAA